MFRVFILLGAFSFYSNNILAQCTGTTTFTNVTNEFTDGSGGSNDYANDLDCQWLIQPTNAQYIYLEFTYLNTEIEDLIYIYNGSTTADPLIGTYSGSPSSSDRPKLIIENSEVLVRFVTDGATTDPGFEIAYVGINDAVPEIQTPTVSTNVLCPGSSASVSFTYTGEFATGNFLNNRFYAILSDDQGNFDSGTIELANSTTSPISFNVPSNITASSNYRIRIESTKPEIISPTNTAPLTLNNITINVSSTDASTFVATATGGQAPYEYKLDGGSYSSSNTFSGLAQGTTYTVFARDANGCENSRDFVINPPMECNILLDAGGQGTTITTHQLGSIPGKVFVNYEMYTIKDEMEVFYNNVLVATTGGLVSGRGTLAFDYNPPAGGPYSCVIRMNAPNSGTAWDYIAMCPIPSGIQEISNTTITGCSEIIASPNFPNPYDNNVNITQTIIPSDPSKKLRYTFQYLGTESSDEIQVYDGLNAQSTLINTYSGYRTDEPSNLSGIATNVDGALTFQFTSDASVVEAGFVIRTECIDEFSGAVNEITTADVSTCDYHLSTPNYPSDYNSSTDITQTFTPSTAGKKLFIDFLDFNTESFDHFYVYDGNTTSSPELGNFRGTSIPPNVYATNSSGQLTIRFDSDGSVTRSGVLAAIKCYTPGSFISFDVPGQIGQTVYDDTNFTIHVTVPITADLANIVPFFDLINGSTASVNGVVQTSGSSIVNFTSPVTYSVTIPGGGTQPWTINVSDDNSNSNPIVSNPLSDLNLSEGFTTSNIDLSGVFSDADGDNLTYTVFSSNTDVIAATVTNATVTLTEVGSGNTTITVTAIDGNGGQVENSFNVNVTSTATNQAPIISFNAGTFSYYEVSIQAPIGTEAGSVEASDPEGDQLIYSISSGNTNNTFGINASSGSIFVSNPNALTASEYTLNIAVSDGTDETTGNFIIQVNNSAYNHCSSNSTLTANSGVITDGSGSLNYDINLNCSWLISPVDGGPITVSFNSFATEAGLDFLRIYDGSNAGAPLLVEASGSNLPGVVTSTGNTVYVQFMSDFTYVDTGWEFTYFNEAALAPTLENQEFEISTNVINNTSIGFLNAVDPQGDPITYSLSSGNTSNAFNLNSSTGELTVINNSDFTNGKIYTLIINVSDDQGNSSEATVIVTILNFPPEVNDQEFMLQASAVNGDIIGNINATDADGDELIYSIVSGNNNGAISLNTNSGQLTVANASTLVDGTTINLVISVDDGNGNLVELGAIIFIGNQAPLFENQTFDMTVNVSDGYLVGTLEAYDLENEVISFAIVSDNSGGIFSLNSATGQLTTANSSLITSGSDYILIVRATDTSGNSTDANITINISNQAPIINSQIFTISSAVSVGLLIGIVEATDPEGDAISFSIIAGNSSNTFAINNLGELSIISISEFSNVNQFLLTIMVEDTFGNSNSAIVTINNSNQPPIINNQVFTISSAVSVGFLVGIVEATDPEGDAISFSITAGNSSNTFSINNLGELSIISISELPNVSQFLLTIVVEDTFGNSNSAIVTINNSNQPPIINNQVFTVSSAVSVGFLVGVVEATDPEGDAISFSITAGNPSNTFAINNLGELIIISISELSNVSQFLLTIVVEDTFGNSNSAIVTINIETADSCSGLLNITELEGTITDGSGLAAYSNNLACEWLINPSISGGIVEINFTSISIEVGKDFVTIYDGSTQNDPLLAQISSNEIPETISSTGKDVLIVFTTDDSNSDDGWELNYKVYVEQTIQFSVIEDQFIETGSIGISASSSSGLPVDIVVDSGPASLEEDALIFTGLGEVTLSATQIGDNLYLPAEEVLRTFNIIPNSILALDSERLKEQRLIVYPNPIDGILNLSEIEEGTKSIKIINLIGEEMYSIYDPSSDIKINTQRWVRGVYFVIVKGNDKYSKYKIVK